MTWLLLLESAKGVAHYGPGNVEIQASKARATKKIL
jgi:hypothetical protein